MSENISACIPCFNGAATLEVAIDSIQSQSVPVAEILVIDDGSSDDSPQIARQRGARVVSHECNLGRGAARATAMRESRGDFTLFCDTGIALPPHFLKTALAHMADQRVSAVFGWVKSAETNTAQRWRTRHLFKSCAPKEFSREAILATGGCLLRRSSVDLAGGFRSELRAGEDSDLGRRLLEVKCSVIFDPELVMTALTHEGVSSVLHRYARWNVQACKTPTWAEYLRLVIYSLKVMVREDLRSADLRCAAISLISPHFLFWTHRCGKLA